MLNDSLTKTEAMDVPTAHGISAAMMKAALNLLPDLSEFTDPQLKARAECLVLPYYDAGNDLWLFNSNRLLVVLRRAYCPKVFEETACDWYRVSEETLTTAKTGMKGKRWDDRCLLIGAQRVSSLDAIGSELASKVQSNLTHGVTCVMFPRVEVEGVRSKATVPVDGAYLGLLRKVLDVMALGSDNRVSMVDSMHAPATVIASYGTADWREYNLSKSFERRRIVAAVQLSRAAF